MEKDEDITVEHMQNAILRLTEEHYRLVTQCAEHEMNDELGPLGWQVTLPQGSGQEIDTEPVIFTNMNTGESFEYGTDADLPLFVSEIFDKVSQKYNAGDLSDDTEVHAAIEYLANAGEKGPRPPTAAEAEALIKASALVYGTDEETARSSITGASIAVFPSYISGGPGYAGKVFCVVYDGGPCYFDVFTEEYDMSSKPWKKTGRLTKEERE